MRKHANISVFVPHLGCKCMCSFCNQVHITGTSDCPNEESVDRAVAEAKLSENYNPQSTELAFFGGSFTAINRDYMFELLTAGYKHVKSGDVCGIRISTRPDAVNSEILEILKQHGVTAIELGAQSMEDDVLLHNRRGHTAEDVVKASALIKEAGFSLGLQMMTGLYTDTDEKSIKTAEKIIQIHPDTVRIYPTVVLEHTRLSALYRSGEYSPETVDSAVSLCGRLLGMFRKADIKVIRLGLHSIDEESFVAGPWHPAFGELCESAEYLRLILTELEKKPKGKYEVYVNKTEISKAVGQHRKNVQTLGDKGYICRILGRDGMEKHKVSVVPET